MREKYADSKKTKQRVRRYLLQRTQTVLGTINDADALKLEGQIRGLSR